MLFNHGNYYLSKECWIHLNKIVWKFRIHFFLIKMLILILWNTLPISIWTVQSNGEPAYRVRTPRLGRSIDSWRLLDAEGATGMAGGEEAIGGQFMQRMVKKSVPFKPRLGKRAQVCGGDWVTTRARGHGTARNRTADGGRRTSPGQGWGQATGPWVNITKP